MIKNGIDADKYGDGTWRARPNILEQLAPPFVPASLCFSLVEIFDLAERNSDISCASVADAICCARALNTFVKLLSLRVFFAFAHDHDMTKSRGLARPHWRLWAGNRKIGVSIYRLVVFLLFFDYVGWGAAPERLRYSKAKYHEWLLRNVVTAKKCLLFIDIT